jgi:hypothetical protein
MTKMKITKNFFIVMIILINIVTLSSCKGQEETDFILYSNDNLVDGEIQLSKPEYNDSITLPLITNYVVDDVSLIDFEGEGFIFDNLSINLLNSTKHVYKDFYIVWIEMRIDAGSLPFSSSINDLDLSISYADKTTDVTLPIGIDFVYNPELVDIESIGSIISKSVSGPSLSANGMFFAFRMNDDVSFESFSQTELPISNIGYAESLTSDFNEINEEYTYTTIEAFSADLHQSVNFSIYFEFDFEVNSNYLNVFSLVVGCEYLDNQFSLLIDVIKDQYTLENSVENYIEGYFISNE